MNRNSDHSGSFCSQHSENKVHFNSEQVDKEHELGIIIQPSGDATLEVHLGFLKVRHHYTIEFDIKDELSSEAVADPLQNLYCRITDIKPTEDGTGHHLTIDFHAHKEKLCKETLLIKSADNSKTLTLILMARVLGKHKGTPMLKEGIKCVGMDPDDESEQSDWGGFN